MSMLKSERNVEGKEVAAQANAVESQKLKLES